MGKNTPKFAVWCGFTKFGAQCWVCAEISGLPMTGGDTTVCGPTQGDTATLDFDVSGVINGGSFFGTGASNMAQTFDQSSQGVIAVSVGNQSAATKITLSDSSGNVIAERTPELSYQVAIISTPKVKSGEKYTLTVGGQTSEFTAKQK